MAKRKGGKRKGGKVSITPKQKAARRRNMAIARAARSKYSGAKRILREVGEKATTIGGGNFMRAAVLGKTTRGKRGLNIQTMGHGRRITSRLKKAGIKYKKRGMMIRIDA